MIGPLFQKIVREVARQPGLGRRVFEACAIALGVDVTRRVGRVAMDEVEGCIRTRGMRQRKRRATKGGDR